MASPDEQTINAPPGVVGTPSGPMPYVNVTSQDYPRLVASLPYFAPVAIADIIEPSVMEAVQGMLPTLVPPYVTAAANAAVQSLAVQLVGSTMTGPLMLSPAIPTTNTMAATKQYVDTMVATVVPEVPPVPANQAWARETGQWIPLAGGGTVTNIATGAGLTGGPITATGTISMANMAANSLKGNNTGAVAAPADIPAGNVLTMIGAAPLNSPVFTGTPVLPTGTTSITQPGGTNNTSLATTAFVASTLGIYAPLASPVFTGTPSLPTGTIAVTQAPGLANNTVATTSFVSTALAPYALTSQLANYLPLAGGLLSGGLASGPAATAVPGSGSLTLNANTVAVQAGSQMGQLTIVAANNANTVVGMQSYGTGVPFVASQHAQGTAVSPTASLNGDSLLTITGQGRATAAAWGAFPSAGIALEAAEAFTATNQGSRVRFTTNQLATIAPVNSLILQGNSATFSGSIYSGGPLASGGGLLNGANGSIGFQLGSPATGNYTFYNNGGGAAMILDTAGDLTIAGSTATKPGSTAWVNPSERSLKQDIQPYTGSLGDLLDLIPVTYRYADDSGFDSTPTHVGLVHDETAHMPELHRKAIIGSTIDAPGREVDALDCGALTFCLINAVKELSARLTAIEGRA